MTLVFLVGIACLLGSVTQLAWSRWLQARLLATSNRPGTAQNDDGLERKESRHASLDQARRNSLDPNMAFTKEFSRRTSSKKSTAEARSPRFDATFEEKRAADRGGTGGEAFGLPALRASTLQALPGASAYNAAKRDAAKRASAFTDVSPDPVFLNVR